MLIVKNYTGSNHFLAISLLVFQYNRDSIHKNGKTMEKSYFYQDHFRKIIRYSESALKSEQNDVFVSNEKRLIFFIDFLNTCRGPQGRLKKTVFSTLLNFTKFTIILLRI